MNNIIHKTFAEIDLQDPFFQSLRNDYPGFDDWFRGKSSQDAFVQYENNKIIGFLYLKVEEHYVDDVEPAIYANKIIKVGTFKIEAHGTKMGEQFIKVIMDYAANENADVCYVTIYEKHSSLINLVQKFGFELYGTKGYGTYKENISLKQNNSHLNYNTSKPANPVTGDCWPDSGKLIIRIGDTDKDASVIDITEFAQLTEAMTPFDLVIYALSAYLVQDYSIHDKSRALNNSFNSFSCSFLASRCFFC